MSETEIFSFFGMNIGGYWCDLAKLAAIHPLAMMNSLSSEHRRADPGNPGRLCQMITTIRQAVVFPGFPAIVTAALSCMRTAT